MKSFVDKKEYVSPEMKVMVVDEDIITFSNDIEDTGFDLPEVPAKPDDN